jgi:hypothetical protein
VALTCEVARERATGIEPAFSAWEAQRKRFHDQPLSRKVQLKASRTYALLFAVVPCLLFLVARNSAKSSCGMPWHGQL